MDTGIGVGDWVEPLVLRRIRPAQNERRFYALAVAVDLFGNILLVRRWGRIGTTGKQSEETHADINSAMDSLERLARTKQRRGYVAFGWTLSSRSSICRKLNQPSPGAQNHRKGSKSF